MTRSVRRKGQRQTLSDASVGAQGPVAEVYRPSSILRELRALPEFGFVGSSALMAAYVAPLGPPRPVLVLPGFVSGDSATLPLRLFLRSIGHKPSGWGLGLNVGASHHIAEGVDRTLRDLAQEYGEPIDIVGWSAGGILGRVLALNRSELVRQVISLGSPINMESSQTNIGYLQRLSARLFLEMPRRFDLDRVPVPSTTVWTRTDGVVPGLACRQSIRHNAEVIEVRGSHTGLGANPAVFYLLADRLALPRSTWRPFDPPDMLRRFYPSIENELVGPAAGLVPAGPAPRPVVIEPGPSPDTIGVTVDPATVKAKPKSRAKPRAKSRAKPKVTPTAAPEARRNGTASSTTRPRKPKARDATS